MAANTKFILPTNDIDAEFIEDVELADHPLNFYRDDFEAEAREAVATGEFVPQIKVQIRYSRIGDGGEIVKTQMFNKPEGGWDDDEVSSVYEDIEAASSPTCRGIRGWYKPNSNVSDHARDREFSFNGTIAELIALMVEQCDFTPADPRFFM